jgi:glucosamine--fructose-6-phosphate aminotransferase (isomerizing)
VVPSTMAALLETADAEVAEVAVRLAETTAIDFIGVPDSAAGAAEGALLYREAPRLATSWFDSRSYLHGPMEAMEPGRGIVVVGDETDDGIAVILRQVRQIGCVAAHVTTGAGSGPADVTGAVTTLHIPRSEGRLIRSVYEMAVLQVLSARSAEHLGLTSGKFRYPQPQVKLKQAIS